MRQKDIQRHWMKRIVIHELVGHGVRSHGGSDLQSTDYRTLRGLLAVQRAVRS